MSVSPAVAPPPGNPRFPLMDGMRAIAVLFVVFAHVSEMTGAIGASWGWLPLNVPVAVALFFAISGFLLYRPFVSGHAGMRPAPRVSEFARRRVLRIVPAYWLALTLLGVLVGIPGFFSDRWWAYYGFAQIYSNTTLAGGIGVAWTVCIEVSFYLLLPAIAMVARALTARSRTWWHAQAAVIGAFALVGVVGCWLVQTHHLPRWSANTLLTTSDWLAAGMALAVVSVALERDRRSPRALRRASAWPAWAAAAVIFVLAARTFDIYGYLLHRGMPPPRPFVAIANHVLLGACATLLLLPAVFGTSGALRRLLGWRPLQYVGLVSYGIYLWHDPLAAWLADYHGSADPIPGTPGLGVQHLFGGHLATLLLLIATIAASVLIATASYRWVELPFLRRKEGSRVRLGRRAPVIAEAE